MADSTDVIANWSTLIENLEASPLAFFESVETGVQKRAIPNIETTRIDHHESGLLSEKREYLRITRNKLIFDMCAAPYGTGFFVSWWLVTPSSFFDPLKTGLLAAAYFVMLIILTAVLSFVGTLLGLLILPLVPIIVRFLGSAGILDDDFMLGIPILGRLYKRFLKPDTYYTVDTARMFQTATHLSVLEALDQLTTAKGLRALSESERKPAMREFSKQ